MFGSTINGGATATGTVNRTGTSITAVVPATAGTGYLTVRLTSGGYAYIPFVVSNAVAKTLTSTTTTTGSVTIARW